MRRCILVLGVLAFLSAFAVNLGAFEVADHAWTKSIVLVGNLYASGMGTGFVVTQDGYIVTAGHVVATNGSVVIFPTPLLYRPARLVYWDPLHDVAVLKAEVANFEVVPLPVGGLADSGVGDEIFTLGHPYGIGWLLSKGVLSGIKYDRGGYAYLFSDVSTAPGSSGSPILNIRGEVIGMVQNGIPGVGCMGVAADRFALMIAAVIQADRELEATRHELEQLQEQARREWKKITELED